jgi:4-amino-4-deoxy-L-arabinose transferase-like glycosyltransferase
VTWRLQDLVGLAGAVALALVALLGTGTVRLPTEGPVEPGSIVPEDGLAWSAPGPNAWPDGTTNESTVVVLEDGRALGPPHTYPTKIARLGGGRFFQGARRIVFSSSDGTDPRTNGRAYSLRYDWFPPWWLVAGLLVATVSFNARRAARAIEILEQAHPAKVGALLFVVALAFRLQVALRNPELTFGGHLLKGVPFTDAEQWFMTARAFSHGDWSSTAFSLAGPRRPLHYGLLGAFFALTGPSIPVARVLNILLSSATAVAIFDGTRRVAPRLVAVLAALVQALLLYDACSDLSVMTEPLGNFLAALSVWAFCVGAERIAAPHPGPPPAAREGVLATVAFAGAGLALGLSNLARPLTLAATAGLPLGLALVARGVAIPWRRVLVGSLVFGAAVLVALLPWMIRQKLVHGIWTISENTAEALYGATTPEYGGTWTTAVGELAGDRSVHDRVAFYSEGTSRNLHEHGAWYARHVLEELAIGFRITQPAAWVLVAACASFAARALASAERSRRRRRATLAAFLLTVVFLVPGSPLLLVTFAASVLALVARRPVAIPGSFFVTTIVSTSLLAMSYERRLTHSVEWTAAALSAWVVLEALRFVETGALSPPALGDAGSWGRPGKWVALAGGVVVATALAGLGRALTVTPPPHDAILPAEPWLARLDPETRSAFAPVLDKVVVRRMRIPPGFLLRFEANEKVFHWYRLFDARPYPFTVFTMGPDLPEPHAVFPGRLPAEAESRELVLVGVPVTRVLGTALELVGLFTPEGKVAFEPEHDVLLAHARYVVASREK